MVLSFQSHVYIYIALSYLYSFILWGIKEIMIVIIIMIIIIMIIIILLIDYWREIKYWWTPIFLFSLKYHYTSPFQLFRNITEFMSSPNDGEKDTLTRSNSV